MLIAFVISKLTAISIMFILNLKTKSIYVRKSTVILKNRFYY